jgi:hypothetical protein
MPPNPTKIFDFIRLTPSSIDELAIKDVANRNPKTAHGMPTGKPPEKVNSAIKITLVEILETQIATQNEYLLVIPKE